MISKIKTLYLKYKEIINYLIFGGLTTLVSLGTKAILFITILNGENEIDVQIATVISFITAVTFAYITNRIFVFESDEKNKIKECFSFFISRIFTLIIDMAIMFLGPSIFKLDLIITALISQVVIIVLNYIISKLFVFKRSKNG